MDADSRLVLYGNSLFLAGIRTELERLTSLEIITVEAGYPDAAALVDSCNPRIVLFDLATQDSAFAVALLRERPGLLLIGVDPNRDEMLVLSSRPQQVLSVSDLVEAILSHLAHASGGLGGLHGRGRPTEDDHVATRLD